jgi:hypothetical protein
MVPCPTPRIGRQAPFPWRELDPELNVRLAELADEGRRLWHRFDLEVRRRGFHSFVPADYDAVLLALLELRAPGLRFIELGSATGVVTIMADLLGYEAYGIEIDPTLVRSARRLAATYESNAKFAVGSFLPGGFSYEPRDGALRGIGEDSRSGYAALGRGLDEFDVVYGYAWPGEEDVLVDMVRAYGSAGARLLLYHADRRLEVHHNPGPQQ